MKRALILLAWLPLFASAAPQLDLGAYQDPHGALTVHLGGDFTDPYFALRALLLARHAGLDVDTPAQAWIKWLLPRQQADGSFARYCNRNGGSWQACAIADADDSLLAMWPELLHLSAPCGAMPPAWRRSAALALAKLDQLRDPQRGTYRISARHTTSLLMDNIEIHASLRSIGARQACMQEGASATAAAQQLAAAIEQVFHPAGQTSYLVSTQAGANAAPSFYPHHVAQVCPALFGLHSAAQAQAGMQAWLAEHGQAWLARSGDHYPWGLVAVAAHKTGLAAPALAWLQNAAPLRHGAHWNILEESAFQSLCAHYGSHAVACQALNRSKVLHE